MHCLFDVHNVCIMPIVTDLILFLLFILLLKNNYITRFHSIFLWVAQKSLFYLKQRDKSRDRIFYK